MKWGVCVEWVLYLMREREREGEREREREKGSGLRVCKREPGCFWVRFECETFGCV